jgi:hypothetical protein
VSECVLCLVSVACACIVSVCVCALRALRAYREGGAGVNKGGSSCSSLFFSNANLLQTTNIFIQPLRLWNTTQCTPLQKGSLVRFCAGVNATQTSLACMGPSLELVWNGTHDNKAVPITWPCQKQSTSSRFLPGMRA